MFGKGDFENMKKERGGLPYSGAWLRAHDPDRFLLSLTAPPARRPALWTLYAFYGEIERTRAVVREPLAGLIRLQWWRDELEKMAAGAACEPHPVLTPLDAAVNAFSLDRDMLLRMIEARCRAFEDHDTVTQDPLAYLREAHAPLVRLAARIDGTPADPAREEELGQAYALALLARQGALGDRAQIEKAVAALAFRMDRPAEKRLRGLHALAALHLMALGRAGFDPRHPGFQEPIPFFALRYARAVYL